MWKWVKRSEINDVKWNQHVNDSEHFRHYYLTYFLDAACKCWEALVWADYEVVWPVPFKIYPVPQVFQPLTAQQLGPIGTREISSDQISDGILMLKKRFWRVEVKFNTAYDCTLREKMASGQNIELKLNQTVDFVQSGYNRNVISNLAKAKKAEIEVTIQNEYSSEAVKAFREGRGAEIKVLNEKYYQDVVSVYKAFENRNEAATWVASIKGEPVAFALILNTNGRILNFFTSTKARARNTGAMHATFNAIISQYSQAANCLDFEGSNDENLAFFYKSFGGEKVEYDHYQSGWQLPKLGFKK